MEISTAAVVGAGTMGSGIAQKLATEGTNVLLLDRTLPLADAGRERIRQVLAQAVERRIYSPEQAETILGRVRPSAALADAASADGVIEAVFEDLAVKRALFAELDRICAPTTLLATNTSSFQVGDLVGGLAHPGRLVGLHFFFHPAKNHLVEVVGHDGTDATVLERAWRWQEATGKLPIASADAPGFVVNRFFVPWLNEAVRLFESGIGIASIEAAAREAFGIGMGPFELMNVTGVPIALHAATTLGERLGSFYAPAPALRAQVERGTGWDLAGPVDEALRDAVSERLWGVVFSVVADLVDEGVSTPGDVDLGARVGLRWPHGPFEQANRIGLDRSLALASSVRERYGLAPSGLLAAQRDLGAAFGLERVRLEVHDGLALLRMNRPDKLNALDPESVAELEERFDDALGRDDVHAIAITGSGKAFVAGADVKFFVDAIKRDDFGAIDRFSARAQALYRRIEQANKPVMALVNGMALGGGAELVLACHHVLAAPRAMIAFPEASLGIYPGLGGTQRLTKRLGKGLARYLLYTGKRLGTRDLVALGLADAVESREALLDAARTNLRVPLPAPRPAVVPDAMVRPAEFLATVSVIELTTGRLTLPGGDDLRDLVQTLARQAPRALAAIERLTAAAEALDIDAGLAQEGAGLQAIFSTADALEGMQALLEGRRAHFEGR